MATRQKDPPIPQGTERRLVHLWVFDRVRDTRTLAKSLDLHPATVRAVLRRADVQSEIRRLLPTTYLDDEQRLEQARQDDARARARAERAGRLWDAAAERLEQLLPHLEGPDVIRAIRAMALPDTYRLQRDAAGRTDNEIQTAVGADRLRSLLERLTVPAPGEENDDAVHADRDAVADHAGPDTEGAGALRDAVGAAGPHGDPSPAR